MSQNTSNRTQETPRNRKLKSTLVIAGLLMLATASGWPLTTQGGQGTDGAKRKVTLVAEEEFFKAVGAVPDSSSTLRPASGTLLPLAGWLGEFSSSSSKTF